MKLNVKKTILIDKVTMSSNLIAIVTNEKDIVIQPVLSE